MTEEMKLLQAARGGDTAAFEQIVKQYQSLVCAITFSGTGRQDLSEELAQETFLRAWKNLGQLTDPYGFRAWLCTIARNLLNNYYRTKRTVPLEAEDVAGLADPTENPSDHLIAQEERAMLEQALLQIPAEYRDALVMYYRQEKSTREVALGLGIKEATVRTRLHRARQMLREEIAGRLERTLERTAPDKTFTKAVMAAVGGTAIGMSASAAGATAGGAGTAAPTGVSAVMSTLAAKLITAAAVVAVSVGAVLAYQHLTESSPVSASLEEAAAVVEESQDAVVTPEVMEIETPEIQEAAADPVDTPTPPPAELPAAAAEPPQPIASEAVECVYALMKEDDTENKIWTKGSVLWRHHLGDVEKICDGKRILVLDHRNQQASYVRGPLTRPEPVVNSLMIAETVSRNVDPARDEIHVTMAGTSCVARQNPAIDSAPDEVVFDVYEAAGNEFLGTAWVDRQTGRLNCLAAAESQGGLIGEWHYEPLDDSVFSTDVPTGYVLEQGRTVNGIVTDGDGNPVTDATVTITGMFTGLEQKLITRTNAEGLFECKLEFQRDDWGIQFPVVIRAVSPSHPDMAAWSCILDPDVEVEKWPAWVPPADPEVVVTKLKSGGSKALCKSIQGLWLVLEPAGSIIGTVANKAGEPIRGAVVDANLYLRFHVNKEQTGEVFTNGFTISAETDESGGYRIAGVPVLEGHANPNGNEYKNCSVTAAAKGYFSKSQYIRNADSSGNADVTFTGERHCDFVLSKNGLTIKGRVVDNYGNPLAHYGGVYYMEQGGGSWHSTGRLDGGGRFVISNGPRADVILIKKETRNDSHNWLHDDETKDLEFVAYPETTFEFAVPPDVNVLDVGDLVLEYPDITAEVYVVDFEGNPVGFVECSFEFIVSKEMLKDRYLKVTDEGGKCVFENVPRIESQRGGDFLPLSLRPSANAPEEYRQALERYSGLTYYHLKYPGDYKHYRFELVLPRQGHSEDRRMRIYSPEGELLGEEN